MINSLVQQIRPFLLTLRQALVFVWQSSPGLAVSSIAVHAFQGLLPLALLYLTKLLVDGVAEGLKAPSGEASLAPIMVILAGLAAVTVVNSLCTTAASLISRLHNQVVTDHMYAVLQTKSVEVDLEYYENAQYQDTLHRAQQEAPHRPTAVLNALLQFGQSAISLLAMAGILWWLHWAVIPVLAVTAIPYFFVRVRQSNQLFQWERARTSLERKTWYVNWLLMQGTSATEVRLFDLGPRLRQWFQEARAILRQERLSLERRWALAGLTTQVIGVAGVFGLYGFVALRTLHGLLTVGDLVMFFQAVQRASGFLESLGWSVSSVYENRLFLGTIQEFLAIPSRLKVPAVPKPFPAPIQTGIAFEHVSFQYPNEDRVVILDFTFTIHPGEHVAFVGANGAGKTTLVKLLCRLYDPTQGTIAVDGVDLREIEIAQVRGAISGVFQDFVKYQMTVRDNIALGVAPSSAGLTEVVAAARQAGIHEAIERLPQGYDTLLGKLFEGGHELSIGEWQKIALARAFLRNSQILILDEPTSSMDAKAEAELFERFHELARGRMAILISHRLSTVKMADRIFVVDRGEIVEQGSHDELMQLHGLYTSLFLTQAQHYQ
jgi:ATP-binding cassette subfamily B protein